MNLNDFHKCAADSRLVTQGDLFFALPGAKTDGHSFLQQVQQQGAKAAVVKKDYLGPSFGLELFYVEDPLQTLQSLAKDHLKKCAVPVIAITGSIGKTTTKEFIGQLLETKYKIVRSLKSHNSKITLPLTILNEIKGDEKYAILEMGMSHPGDIGKLVQIAPPTIALLTHVTFVHSMNFSSYEEIYENKCEIFSSSATKIKIKPENYISLSKEMIDLFKLPGEHSLFNLSAAVTVCLAAGMSESEIKAALPSLKMPEKRLEFISKNGVLFLNDSYNACWLSVKGAFDVLSKLPNLRKIAVLGDIKEQGAWSDETHQNVLNYASDKVESLFLLGPEWERFKLQRHMSLFKDKQSLFEHLKHSTQEGDAVLVKGSNSHQLWTISEDYS